MEEGARASSTNLSHSTAPIPDDGAGDAECISGAYSAGEAVDKPGNKGSNCAEALPTDLHMHGAQPDAFPAETDIEDGQINVKGCSVGREDARHAPATSNVRNASYGMLSGTLSTVDPTDNIPGTISPIVSERARTKHLNLSRIIRMTVMDARKGNRGGTAGEAIDETDSLNKDGKQWESGGRGGEGDDEGWTSLVGQNDVSGLQPDHLQQPHVWTPPPCNILQLNGGIANGAHPPELGQWWGEWGVSPTTQGQTSSSSFSIHGHIDRQGPLPFSSSSSSSTSSSSTSSSCSPTPNLPPGDVIDTSDMNRWPSVRRAGAGGGGGRVPGALTQALNHASTPTTTTTTTTTRPSIPPPVHPPVSIEKPDYQTFDKHHEAHVSSKSASGQNKRVKKEKGDGAMEEEEWAGRDLKVAYKKSCLYSKPYSATELSKPETLSVSLPQTSYILPSTHPPSINLSPPSPTLPPTRTNLSPSPPHFSSPSESTLATRTTTTGASAIDLDSASPNIAPLVPEKHSNMKGLSRNPHKKELNDVALSKDCLDLASIWGDRNTQSSGIPPITASPPSHVLSRQTLQIKGSSLINVQPLKSKADGAVVGESEEEGEEGEKIRSEKSEEGESIGAENDKSMEGQGKRNNLIEEKCMKEDQKGKSKKRNKEEEINKIENSDKKKKLEKGVKGKNKSKDIVISMTKKDNNEIAGDKIGKNEEEKKQEKGNGDEGAMEIESSQKAEKTENVIEREQVETMTQQFLTNSHSEQEHSRMIWHSLMSSASEEIHPELNKSLITNKPPSPSPHISTIVSYTTSKTSSSEKTHHISRHDSPISRQKAKRNHEEVVIDGSDSEFSPEIPSAWALSKSNISTSTSASVSNTHAWVSNRNDGVSNNQSDSSSTHYLSLQTLNASPECSALLPPSPPLTSPSFDRSEVSEALKPPIADGSTTISGKGATSGSHFTKVPHENRTKGPHLLSSHALCHSDSSPESSHLLDLQELSKDESTANSKTIIPSTISPQGNKITNERLATHIFPNPSLQYHITTGPNSRTKLSVPISPQIPPPEKVDSSWTDSRAAETTTSITISPNFPLTALMTGQRRRPDNHESIPASNLVDKSFSIDSLYGGSCSVYQGTQAATRGTKTISPTTETTCRTTSNYSISSTNPTSTKTDLTTFSSISISPTRSLGCKTATPTSTSSKTIASPKDINPNPTKSPIPTCFISPTTKAFYPEKITIKTPTSPNTTSSNHENISNIYLQDKPGQIDPLRNNGQICDHPNISRSSRHHDLFVGSSGSLSPECTQSVHRSNSNNNPNRGADSDTSYGDQYLLKHQIPPPSDFYSAKRQHSLDDVILRSRGRLSTQFSEKCNEIQSENCKMNAENFTWKKTRAQKHSLNEGPDTEMKPTSINRNNNFILTHQLNDFFHDYLDDDKSFLGAVPDISLVYDPENFYNKNNFNKNGINNEQNPTTAMVHLRDENEKKTTGRFKFDSEENLSLRERHTPYIYSGNNNDKEDYRKERVGFYQEEVQGCVSGWNFSAATSESTRMNSELRPYYVEDGRGAHCMTVGMTDNDRIGSNMRGSLRGVAPAEQSLSLCRDDTHSTEVINAGRPGSNCPLRMRWGAHRTESMAAEMSPISRVLASLAGKPEPSQLVGSHHQHQQQWMQEQEEEVQEEEEVVVQEETCNRRKRCHQSKSNVSARLESYVLSGTQVSGTVRRPPPTSSCHPTAASANHSTSLQRLPNSPDVTTYEDDSKSLYTYRLPDKYYPSSRQGAVVQPGGGRGGFHFNPAVEEAGDQDIPELTGFHGNEIPLSQQVPEFSPRVRCESHPSATPSTPQGSYQHVPTNPIYRQKELNQEERLSEIEEDPFPPPHHSTTSTTALPPHLSSHQQSSALTRGYLPLNGNIDCPLDILSQLPVRNEEPPVEAATNSRVNPTVRTPILCHPYQDGVVHTSYRTRHPALPHILTPPPPLPPPLTPPQVVPKHAISEKEKLKLGSSKVVNWPSAQLWMAHSPTSLSLSQDSFLGDIGLTGSPSQVIKHSSYMPDMMKKEPRRTDEEVKAEGESGGGRGSVAEAIDVAEMAIPNASTPRQRVGIRDGDDMLIRNERRESLDACASDKGQERMWSEKGCIGGIYQSLQVDSQPGVKDSWDNRWSCIDVLDRGDSGGTRGEEGAERRRGRIGDEESRRARRERSGGAEEGRYSSSGKTGTGVGAIWEEEGEGRGEAGRRGEETNGGARTRAEQFGTEAINGARKTWGGTGRVETGEMSGRGGSEVGEKIRGGKGGQNRVNEDKELMEGVCLTDIIANNKDWESTPESNNNTQNTSKTTEEDKEEEWKGQNLESGKTFTNNSSKWDFFKEEEAGDSKERGVYHGRFSPKSQLPSLSSLTTFPTSTSSATTTVARETTPSNPLAPLLPPSPPIPISMMDDIDDSVTTAVDNEWQDDIIVTSDNTTTDNISSPLPPLPPLHQTSQQANSSDPCETQNNDNVVHNGAESLNNFDFNDPFDDSSQKNASKPLNNSPTIPVCILHPGVKDLQYGQSSVIHISSGSSTRSVSPQPHQNPTINLQYPQAPQFPPSTSTFQAKSREDLSDTIMTPVAQSDSESRTYRSSGRGQKSGFRPPRPASGVRCQDVRLADTSSLVQVGGNPKGNPGGNSLPITTAHTPGLSGIHGKRQVTGMCGELRFVCVEEVEVGVSLKREAIIPPAFTCMASYQQCLIQAVREHLNIMLYDLASRYYSALSRADLSAYEPGESGVLSLSDSAASLQRGGGPSAAVSTNPQCGHGVPSKIVQVKKSGQNQGRLFYACASDRDQQCGFFKWADEVKHGAASSSTGANPGVLKLSDGASISTYLRSASINFYCGCSLVYKCRTLSSKTSIPSWVKKKMGMAEEEGGEKRWYLRLPRKEASSAYTKDDLWIVTQQFYSNPSTTFLARSSFYGPNQNMEVEVEPLGRFSPSNWQHECACHAIHVGNAASELAVIKNLEEAVHVSTLPILPHLLHLDHPGEREKRGQFSMPKLRAKTNFFVPGNLVDDMACEMVEKHRLNADQAAALLRVAAMFATTPGGAEPGPPITLIHGVFGAGKSYLLAVIVLLLIKLFEENDSHTPGVPDPSKILIASTTNVAVDRILLNLLDLGHDDFVRVGSVKKIAKPVLPYSVHATGSQSQELRDLQDMLRSEALTPAERVHVRRSIDQHRKGVNKKRLESVRVVGVTCAASSFQCLKNFQFPVVLLDECSQMTEPMSLLPIARFGCQKLVLVGDPKQLDPTIQGSEAAHRQGLEQTLFDRLLLMGHPAVMLRTQYRCHPLISAIPNKLFYDKQLQDGVTPTDRPPLAPNWPALCFLDVSEGQEKGGGGGVKSGSGSYSNEHEAGLVVSLIDRLVGAGVDTSSIGVITLYKAQQALILQLLTHHTDSELRAVQVSTVDAFQGGERGVIILSCVRTRHLGFIDSDKRTNVALSRAKNHLLIVGHRRNLTNNPLWRKVIKYCLEAPGGMKKGEEFLQSLGDGAADNNPGPVTVAPSEGSPITITGGSGSCIDLTEGVDKEDGDMEDFETESEPLPKPARKTRSHVFNADDFSNPSELDNSDSGDDDLPNFSL